MRNIHFYSDHFVSLFSRKVVGWQVFECESAELAAGFLRGFCERQGIPRAATVHSFNGSPMKDETMQRLGVAHWRSCPAVSDDNPYSKSLFRALNYRFQLPHNPFADILQTAETRSWVPDFVHGYNLKHRHSTIRFESTTQRHTSLEVPMLAKRTKVYAAVRQANSNR